MTPLEAAAAVAIPINRFGSRFMLDPSFYVPAIEHGYQGYDFYFAGRGGVFGDVDALVIDAAFGFMDAAFVADNWNAGRSVGPVARAAALFSEQCAVWGEQHLPSDIDYAELAELTKKVVAATPVASLSLFAGWKAMPVPSSDKRATAHLLNVLREYRGGVHLLAVAASGCSPLDAVLVNEGEGGARFLGHKGPFDAVSAETVQSIAAAEIATNELAAIPFAALDEHDRSRFVELTTTAFAGLS